MILENIPSTFTAKYSFILASYGGLYQGCSSRPAPQKAGLAPPRPAEIDKTCGAKLTVNSKIKI